MSPGFEENECGSRKLHEFSIAQQTLSQIVSDQMFNFKLKK